MEPYWYNVDSNLLAPLYVAINNSLLFRISSVPLVARWVDVWVTEMSKDGHPHEEENNQHRENGERDSH